MRVLKKLGWATPHQGGGEDRPTTAGGHIAAASVRELQRVAGLEQFVLSTPSTQLVSSLCVPRLNHFLPTPWFFAMWALDTSWATGLGISIPYL